MIDENMLAPGIRKVLSLLKGVDSSKKEPENTEENTPKSEA